MLQVLEAGARDERTLQAVTGKRWLERRGRSLGRRTLSPYASTLVLPRKRGQFVIEALRLDIWVRLANGAMPFRLTTNDLAQETAPSVGAP